MCGTYMLDIVLIMLLLSHVNTVLKQQSHDQDQDTNAGIVEWEF